MVIENFNSVPNNQNKAVQNHPVKRASLLLTIYSGTPKCFTTSLRNNSSVFSAVHVVGVVTNTIYLVNRLMITITKDISFTYGKLEIKSIDTEAHASSGIDSD